MHVIPHVIPHDPPPALLCTLLQCPPVLRHAELAFGALQPIDLVVGVVMLCVWLVALFWVLSDDDAQS